MTEQIIGGVCTLGGVIIGALLNGLFQYLEVRRENAKKQVVSLCDQVISFYTLEKKYIDEVVKLRAEKGIKATEKGVMDEFRHLIYEEEACQRIHQNITTAEKLKAVFAWSTGGHREWRQLPNSRPCKTHNRVKGKGKKLSFTSRQSGIRSSAPTAAHC